MELVYERKHFVTSATLLNQKLDLCPDPSVSLNIDQQYSTVTFDANFECGNLDYAFKHKNKN